MKKNRSGESAVYRKGMTVSSVNELLLKYIEAKRIIKKLSYENRRMKSMMKLPLLAGE